MKLESHRLFDVQAFGRRVSAEYGAAGHIGAGMLRVLRLSLLEPSNACRLLWARLTGERLALTLAREWLNTRTEPLGRKGLLRRSQPAPKTDA